MKNIIIAMLLLAVFPFALPSCSPSGSLNDSKIKMRASVEELGEKISVSVLESEYTSGPHLVITSPSTVYLDKNGNAIRKTDIKVGDIVTVYYSGQVMLSYPPQIVAHKIIKE